MSVERDEGNVTLVCDGAKCNETFDAPDPENFRAMIEAAKRKGWSVFPVGHDWLHMCPACGEDL